MGRSARRGDGVLGLEYANSAPTLATGQLAQQASHELKFGDHPPGFAVYEKLRRDWSVE